jgi:hypothetical protein
MPLFKSENRMFNLFVQNNWKLGFVECWPSITINLQLPFRARVSAHSLLTVLRSAARHEASDLVSLGGLKLAIKLAMTRHQWSSQFQRAQLERQWGSKPTSPSLQCLHQVQNIRTVHNTQSCTTVQKNCKNTKALASESSAWLQITTVISGVWHFGLSWKKIY